VSRGTDGADLLNGNFFPTRLYGEGGDDRLFGTGSTANRMDGGPGNDQIESGGLLLGRYGNDRLVGGTGPDRISGHSGNDYVNALDRERDSVRCGDGRSDRVIADRVDSVARDCERVSRR
jgi:Ca2+-binding RTX toxin-like protein